MLRQDQFGREGAAFRSADWTRIARSFLVLLARRRRRLRRRMRKYWRKHGTAWEAFLTLLAAGAVGFLIAYLGS